MQIEASELHTAWQALAGQPEKSGWRSIAVGRASPRFRAGIAFPESAESLLVGFNVATQVRDSELPEGTGFSVSRAADDLGAGFRIWFSLSRSANASLEMFGLMATDIIASLDGRGQSDSYLFALMLARIRAWQEFMRRPADAALSPERELGLLGELTVLEKLLALGVGPTAVLGAWQGPARGLHDFITPAGAIEVKTTIAASTFHARISSLEQLDDQSGQSLILAAVRLCLQSDGRSLPEAIRDLRSTLLENKAALGLLEHGLLLAGYLETTADAYDRKFACASLRAFLIDEKFPRLVRSSTAPEIISAEYEVDLDLVTSPADTLENAINAHGLFQA